VNKFVLNKKAFQDQVLYGPEIQALLASLIGPNGVVEQSDNSKRGGRARARIYGNSKDVADGSLLRSLG
jgi:hypothetical protein